MMFNKTGKQGGFVKAIIVIVIALIVLGYLGYNIEDILKHPLVQKNLSWAWNLTKTIWEKFLKTPVTWFWDNTIGRLQKDEPVDLGLPVSP